MSRDMTKPTKWHVRPAKTQISLGICPVWSESSFSAWRTLSIERTAKTLIRLGECPDWSESPLGANSFCWFCRVAAQIIHQNVGCFFTQNNGYYRSCKLKTIIGSSLELRSHIQIISDCKTITRKLNKNHDYRPLTMTRVAYKNDVFVESDFFKLLFVYFCLVLAY